MKTYIIYYLNGSYQILSTSFDLEGNEHKVGELGINYHSVDYIICLKEHVNESELRYKKYLPDGNIIWNKQIIIENKIKEIKEKRSQLFLKLDVDFLISLENDGGSEKNIIKKTKIHLRELSCRTEMQQIHDCEKLIKFNAFYNLAHIEILDPGYGCNETIPSVTIDEPIEDGDSFGLRAAAKAARGANGQLVSIEVTRLGSGYKTLPNIKISGYDSNNAKHPILKPIIKNII